MSCLVILEPRQNMAICQWISNKGIEQIERRALGFFIDDMLSLCTEEDKANEL